MRKTLFGLSPADVDDQLAELLEQVQRLEMQNEQLRRELERRPAGVSRLDLMDEVGERIGVVLREAQSAADQMLSEAHAEATAERAHAQRDATDILAAAESEALRTREEAQSTAEQVTAVATRYADELRSEAERGARIVRDTAQRQASDIVEDANRNAAIIRGAAEEYGREVPANADREAQRALAEARASAEGIVDAALREHKVMLESARAEASQLRSEADAERHRLKAELTRMREARNLLTDHLASTRVDLEDVLRGIADNRLDPGPSLRERPPAAAPPRGELDEDEL
jgi:cell division septum initiation protein DivIVA